MSLWNVLFPGMMGSPQTFSGGLTDLLGVDPIGGGLGGFTAMPTTAGQGLASESYYPPAPTNDRSFPSPPPSAPSSSEERRGGLLGNVLGLGEGGRGGLLGLNLFGLDDSMRLPMAMAMIGGGSNSQAFSNAANIYANMAPKLEDRKQKTADRNQTLAYLDKAAPEIAQMIRSGLPTTDGWSLYLNERKGGSNMTANMREFQVAKQDGYKGSFADWMQRNPESKTDQFGLPTSGSISQKVKALMAQGFDEQSALGVASGRYSVSVHPMTGERALVDVATQQLIPLRMAGQQGGTPQGGQQAGGQQAQPQQSKTLMDMADDATGAYSSFRTGVANTVGQLPGSLGETAQAPKQVEAQQAFELFKRDLVRSLALNPKFPMAEQQRIESLVPRGVMTSSETLKTSMKTLDQELARIEQQAAAGVNDPNSPVEQRQNDMMTLRGVKAARERLGVANGAGATGTGSGRTSSGLKWSVGQP